MIDPCEPCAQTTAENVRQRIGEPGPHHRSLSIAILGPAVGGSSNAGGRKRQQIRRQLREAGHCPFYPEERIGPDGLWVDRERAVLSDASVDLIIVLQTDDSIGVMGELTAFVTEDAIVAKTAVLTPARYYRPEQSFLANAVSYYRVRVPYTERQFVECRLLNDCMEIIHDLLSGDSPLVLDPDP